jgi:hypothetical protein
MFNGVVHIFIRNITESKEVPKVRTPIFQPSAAVQMRTLKNGQQVFGNVAVPGPVVVQQS